MDENTSKASFEMTCSHPGMFQHVGEERIPPTTFTARCIHNYACPTCGHGVGSWPDPCDR